MTERRRDAFVADVLGGRDRGVGAALLRGLLTPLALLHRIGLEAYLLPYRTGVRRRFRLRAGKGRPVPVIAIGNLTSGGTGKTPMAALVAKRLLDAGCRVVLLSRGYGGAEGGPRIVSDGARVLSTPEAAGDEPILLARLLAQDAPVPGVPVVVGKDRRRSGALALERFSPDVIVLDDALQFWQLHRDLDIVLLDAARPFDNDYLLPRGLLREPPSHLARIGAGVIVLTRADRVAREALEKTRARVQSLAPRALVLTARHAPVGWVRASDDALLSIDALAGRGVCAFAGIADGSAFIGTAESLGVRIVDRRDFGDHHAYTDQDVAALAALRCDATVTTEKDLVKVAPRWPRAAPPLYALRIGMEMDDPARFWERLARATNPAAGVSEPAKVSSP